MASEKTPTLYLEKVPFEYENKKTKICSKSTVSWFLAALLIGLLIVVSIQFLYPAVEKKFAQDVDKVQVFEGSPVTLKVIPPVMTDYISEEVHKLHSSEETSIRKSHSSEENSKSKSMEKVLEKNKPWDLEFQIDPLNLCASRNPPNSEQYHHDPEVKLLMMVLSSTSHFEQRKAIRNTWGSIAENPHGPMRLGFVLGTTKNKTEKDLIKEESSFYGDIIQVDFEETAEQQTTKSILMLKWVAKRCPHAQFFLKADDDTFVNVGIIARILGQEPFISEDKFIGGYVQQGVLPSRIPEEKFYVPEVDYPDEEFPSYVSGSAYVTTGPTAVELFQASKDVMPFLPMDDVFITGLCGKQIDATLLHEPRFRLDDPPSTPTWQAYSNIATAHKVTPNTLEMIWDDMTRSLLDHLLNFESAMNETIILRKRSV